MKREKREDLAMFNERPSVALTANSQRNKMNIIETSRSSSGIRLLSVDTRILGTAEEFLAARRYRFYISVLILHDIVS